MWAGHADGKVTGFSLHAAGACILPRQITQWQVLSAWLHSTPAQ